MERPQQTKLIRKTAVKLFPNSTNLREYTLPVGVYSIVPSGFMADINYLKSRGYPQPPPLVLEIGGKLLNTFEEDFGQLYGYKDYDCNLDHRSSWEEVWADLKKEVVTNIGRSVVSLSSYDGDVRYFSCTGLLIKWHKTGIPVILTSASLVRSRVDEDKIDEKLKIKVLLPPNQSAAGTLELYHSDYNIAVISLQKRLYGIRPENIFCTVERPRRVVAIGREAEDGLLMGTIGKRVKKRADDKLSCEDLKLSTSQIKKVGIGGPLVSLFDGCFVGMNFYGETDVTPYLPRRIIVEVLSGVDLPSQRAIQKLKLQALLIWNLSYVSHNSWVPEIVVTLILFDMDF
ncbi:Cyclin-L1-1 [Hordeum vulgare]|nr:Cyclin-L1-1 [Hordeum vulgare]